MPSEMSVDLKERIVAWYLNDQYSYRHIAALANRSIGHASNVLRNYREYGQVKNPFSCRTGRPSEVNEEDIVYIHSLLEANPTLYLDELQTRLLRDRRPLYGNDDSRPRALLDQLLTCRDGATITHGVPSRENHETKDDIVGMLQVCCCQVSAIAKKEGDTRGQLFPDWAVTRNTGWMGKNACSRNYAKGCKEVGKYGLLGHAAILRI